MSTRRKPPTVADIEAARDAAEDARFLRDQRDGFLTDSVEDALAGNYGERVLGRAPYGGIARDRSDLPTRTGQPMLISRPAFDFWRADNDARYGNRPKANTAARFRHSWAGGCARETGYRIADVPISDPPEVGTAWIMRMGQIGHDELGAAYIAAWPDAIAEAVCEIPGHSTAGHADLLIPAHPVYGRTVVEWKLINGYSFKRHTGGIGQAEGPNMTAETQGALNAYALNADTVAVIDVATEKMKAKERRKAWGDPDDPLAGIVAEWIYPRSEWEPWALAELDRIERIYRRLDDGRLAPRAISDPEVPSTARVVDPDTGTWQVRSATGQVLETGTTWRCQGCWYRTQCVTDGV